MWNSSPAESFVLLGREIKQVLVPSSVLLLAKKYFFYWVYIQEEDDDKCTHGLLGREKFNNCNCWLMCGCSVWILSVPAINTEILTAEDVNLELVGEWNRSLALVWALRGVFWDLHSEWLIQTQTGGFIHLSISSPLLTVNPTLPFK